MDAIQATLVAALITSPLLYAIFEWAKNKLAAKFAYTGWQAIFLANGQVYFGKIGSVSRDDITLTDIYYLKESNPLEHINPTHIPMVGIASKLAKLGNELHAPKDKMVISRQSILFTEELRETGQLVKEITNYKEDQL